MGPIAWVIMREDEKTKKKEKRQELPKDLLMRSQSAVVGFYLSFIESSQEAAALMPRSVMIISRSVTRDKF